QCAKFPCAAARYCVTCALRHGGLRHPRRAFAGIRNTRSPVETASGLLSSVVACGTLKPKSVSTEELTGAVRSPLVASRIRLTRSRTLNFAKSAETRYLTVGWETFRRAPIFFLEKFLSTHSTTSRSRGLRRTSEP